MLAKAWRMNERCPYGLNIALCTKKNYCMDLILRRVQFKVFLSFWKTNVWGNCDVQPHACGKYANSHLSLALSCKRPVPLLWGGLLKARLEHFNQDCWWRWSDLTSRWTFAAQKSICCNQLCMVCTFSFPFVFVLCFHSLHACFFEDFLNPESDRYIDRND